MSHEQEIEQKKRTSVPVFVTEAAEKKKAPSPPVRRTIHYPLTGIETAAQERPATEAQEAKLDALDGPTFQGLGRVQLPCGKFTLAPNGV